MTTLIMVVYARPKKNVDNTMVKRQVLFLTSVSVISFSVSPTAMALITHVSRDYWWSRIQVLSLMLTQRNLVVAEGTFNRQQTFSDSNVEVDNAKCHVPIIFWGVRCSSVTRSTRFYLTLKC